MKCNHVCKDFVKEQCSRLDRSPYVIVNNHPELNVSIKGLYNYINQQVLLVRDIDLKRKVKFKPRKTTDKGIVDCKAFIGRTYADFQTLKPAEFVEMDTVVSAKGSNKWILTFYIFEIELLIARLLTNCFYRCVENAIDKIERSLGTYDFLTMFGGV